MGMTTLRRGFVLLLSAVLLAVLIAVSAVPVAAEDDEDQPGVNMDALSGLAADEGGGPDPDGASTGDLNDPLGGGTGGASDEADGEATGSETGTTEGSDPADPATSTTNPMFKLMLELILEDVQNAEAEAKLTGKTLTDAQRADVAAKSVKDLITFLQETGLLGDVDTRELLKQIEGIPTPSQDG